jgi:UDP-3-O-[3-hydroxymyristoyl] glucosamine N-acyltransferase LpxD
MSKSFQFSELTSFLKEGNYIDDIVLNQKDFTIQGFSPISETKEHTLSWMKNQELNWGEIEASVVICAKALQTPENTKITFLSVVNPRQVFAKVLANFNKEEQLVGVEDTVRLGKNCNIGKGVYIGHYSVIGDNVCIGDYSDIRHHVVVNDNTKIGNYCLIKSNTVIGEKGFGFELENDGTPIQVPHIGTVEIGDYVEIGALNTIVQGSLGKTVIKNHVKTDDHVHIAHNMHIDENVIITACAEFSGGVKIEKNVWIGPNVSVIEKVVIKERAFVGIGSVVTKDVESNMVVAGNPAKPLKKRFND